MQYIFTAAHLTCQLFKLTAGSSSIDESQKMDRPSISVMSPTSPGMLRDLPLVLPGQLSVSVKPHFRENIYPCFLNWKKKVVWWHDIFYLLAQIMYCQHFVKFEKVLFLFTKVKLWYDKVGHQLIVNVLQARELPPRPDGRPRNPYVKMYFLPDRR